MPQATTTPTYPHLVFAFVDELTAQQSAPIAFRIAAPAVHIELRRMDCLINKAGVLSVTLISEGEDLRRIDSYRWSDHETPVMLRAQTYRRSIAGGQWTIINSHTKVLDSRDAEVVEELSTILHWIEQHALSLPKHR